MGLSRRAVAVLLCVITTLGVIAFDLPASAQDPSPSQEESPSADPTPSEETSPSEEASPSESASSEPSPSDATSPSVSELDYPEVEYIPAPEVDPIATSSSEPSPSADGEGSTSSSATEEAPWQLACSEPFGGSSSSSVQEADASASGSDPSLSFQQADDLAGDVSTTATTTLVEAVSAADSELAMLPVADVSGFDESGGWALLDAGTSSVEPFCYRGVDAASNAFTEVTRIAPTSHPASALVVEIPSLQVPATTQNCLPVVDPGCEFGGDPCEQLINCPDPGGDPCETQINCEPGDPCEGDPNCGLGDPCEGDPNCGLDPGIIGDPCEGDPNCGLGDPCEGDPNCGLGDPCAEIDCSPPTDPCFYTDSTGVPAPGVCDPIPPIPDECAFVSIPGWCEPLPPIPPTDPCFNADQIGVPVPGVCDPLPTPPPTDPCLYTDPAGVPVPVVCDPVPPPPPTDPCLYTDPAGVPVPGVCDPLPTPPPTDVCVISDGAGVPVPGACDPVPSACDLADDICDALPEGDVGPCEGCVYDSQPIDVDVDTTANVSEHLQDDRWTVTEKWRLGWYDRNGNFHELSRVRLSAGIDLSGRTSFWAQETEHLSGQSVRATHAWGCTEQQYFFPDTDCGTQTDQDDVYTTGAHFSNDQIYHEDAGRYYYKYRWRIRVDGHNHVWKFPKYGSYRSKGFFCASDGDPCDW